MPWNNIVVDDTNAQYIAYAEPNAWTVITGSSRQWESTVHSTNTYGATASFRFFGNSFIMYGTIPAGSGTVYVDITIDGGTPARVTRTSGSDNVYADKFYQSPLLSTGSMHTVVFTNRGQSTDSSFQFDRVELLSLDGNPTITSPPNLGNGIPTPQATIDRTIIPSTTSSPGPGLHSQIISSTGLVSSNMSSLGSTSSQRGDTSIGPTVTLTQQLTKTGQPGSTSTFVISTPGTQANSRRVNLSAGAIAGIAIGGLVILALFFAGCFVLKRRSKHSQTHQMLRDNEPEMRQTHGPIYIPTPYVAESHPASESTRRLLEKGSVHPTSVTRPQLETHPRTARPSTDLHATDGNPADGHPQSPNLNAGQEESRRESAFEAPPAYQPNRGSAAAPIPRAFAGGPSMR